MKQSEIKKCAACGLGVMHDKNITFYRFSLQYMVVDLGAVQRQHGLEMFLGSGEIAAVMGPQEDLAKSISEATGMICLPCATRTPIAFLSDLVAGEVPA